MYSDITRSSKIEQGKEAALNLFKSLIIATTLGLFHFLSPELLGQTLEKRLQAQSPVGLATTARDRGNPRRGAILFYQPFMACRKCHTHGDASHALGPDLTQRATETTDISIVESILNPSKIIRRGFESLSVTTTDGKTVTGLLLEDHPDRLILRDARLPDQKITIPRDTIDEVIKNSQSIMPSGLVNQLATEQQFYDLVRYLIEISENGIGRAKELQPLPSIFAARPLPDYEKEIDHAGIIKSLNGESLRRGKTIYDRLCSNCHGTHDHPGSLPTALRFTTEKFKNGCEPYTIVRRRRHGQRPVALSIVPDRARCFQ